MTEFRVVIFCGAYSRTYLAVIIFPITMEFAQAARSLE